MSDGSETHWHVAVCRAAQKVYGVFTLHRELPLTVLDEPCNVKVSLSLSEVKKVKK